jgi:phosphoglycolate phosphatase
MVATNKPRRFTMQILEGLHVASAFRKVVAAEDVQVRKPDPAPLHACLEGLEVDVSDVVVVGDHVNDIQAAQALGAISVAATYGMTPAGLLWSARPDLTIDSFAELTEKFPSR